MLPDEQARAHSSPASRPIVEGLRSAIFAAHAAIVEEDRVVGAEHDRRQSALSGIRVTTTSATAPSTAPSARPRRK
jgi:hypothetical protein